MRIPSKIKHMQVKDSYEADNSSSFDDIFSYRLD
jgi:hypothetical protein